MSLEPAALRLGNAEKGVDWIVGPKDGKPAVVAYAIEGDWIGGTGADANATGDLPRNCEACQLNYSSSQRTNALNGAPNPGFSSFSSFIPTRFSLPSSCTLRG